MKMAEFQIVIKDELDGRVTIKILPEHANKLPARGAKNLVTFVTNLVDNLPQRVRNDIFDGAQVLANIEFAVKPRKIIPGIG